MTKKLDSILLNQKRNYAVESLIDRPTNPLTYILSNLTLKNITRRINYITHANATLLTPDLALSRNVSTTVIDWFSRENYLSLGDVSVYAPIGLKVTYLEYVAALENSYSYLSKIEDELLHPLIEFIGKGINNPSRLASKTTVPIDGTLLNVTVDVPAKVIAKCFDKNKRSDMIKYKDAVKRNNDFVTTVDRMLALQDNLVRQRPESVLKVTSTLFSMSEHLKNALDTNPEFEDYRNNPESYKKGLTRIADLLIHAAQWVEYYGIFRHQVMVFSTALSDTEKKLRDLAKK